MMKSLLRLMTVAVAIALGTPANGAEIDEIIVEALIDGDSTFHVRPETVWWESGNVSKPGRWSGQNEPTYINGAPWKPRWRSDNPRGRDKSASYSVSLKSTDLEFELLAVTAERGKPGIDQRTPVTAGKEGGHFVVRFPDPENGARWYKFAVRKKKK